MNILRAFPWVVRAVRFTRDAKQVNKERGGKGRVTGYDTGKAAGRYVRNVFK